VIRRLLAPLSVLSLLLCVATCVLWVRSYWARTTVTRNSSPDHRHLRRIECSSAAGGLAVWVTTWTVGRNAVLGPSQTEWSWVGDGRPALWSPAGRLTPLKRGFVINDVEPWRNGWDLPEDPEDTIAFVAVGVPHWATAAALAVMPLAWLAVAVRRGLLIRRRSRRGLCPA
jgi:hypothetical protein